MIKCPRSGHAYLAGPGVIAFPWEGKGVCVNINATAADLKHKIASSPGSGGQ